MQSGDEFPRRAQAQNLAPIHDADSIAQDLGFLHVVRRQQNRPAFALELAHQFPQSLPSLRIQARRRFIEEDEFRVVDERQAQGETLALAAAQAQLISLGLILEMQQAQELGRRARG